ncbi:SBBP repeat-containing protein [Kaarinaea lacus]
MMNTNKGIAQILRRGMVSAAALVCFSTATVYADSWVRTFGTTPVEYWGKSDYGADIVRDDRGNLYVTGGYNSRVSGAITLGVDMYDFMIAKLGPTGNLIWLDTLSSLPDGGQEYGIAIDRDRQGNLYVMGRTNGNLNGGGTIGWSQFLAKYNQDGSRLWLIQFAEGETLTDMVTDEYGNSYSVGYRHNGTTFDAVLYIHDDTGHRLSSRIFSTSYNEIATGIVLDDVRQMFITTKNTNTSGAWYDYYDTKIYKIGRRGQILWEVESDSTFRDEPKAITFNRVTNEVVVVGELVGADRSFMMSFSAITGAKRLEVQSQWYTYFSDVAIDTYGNAHITGRYGKNWVAQGNEGTDILYDKYDSNGNLLEHTYFGAVGVRDNGNGIVLDLNNNYYITGVIKGDIPGAPNSGTISSGDVIVSKNMPQ